MTSRNNRSDVEADRIKQNKCPRCGHDIKDKGSYIRCTKCPWELTNGTYNSKEGYAIMYD